MGLDLRIAFIVALAMLSLTAAAPLSFAGAASLAPAMRSAAVSMRAEGEIGVTPPLGVYDPLNLLATPVEYPRRDYERYVELEIKHGRVAMLAFLGILTTEAGFRFPGYLSKSLDLKFEDVPGGPFESYAAVPAIGWLQIVAFCILIELNAYQRADPTEPGNIGGPSWIRYDDPEVKKFKLNVSSALALSCHQMHAACPCSFRSTAHLASHVPIGTRNWRADKGGGTRELAETGALDGHTEAHAGYPARECLTSLLATWPPRGSCSAAAAAVIAHQAASLFSLLRHETVS